MAWMQVSSMTHMKQLMDDVFNCPLTKSLAFPVSLVRESLFNSHTNRNLFSSKFPGNRELNETFSFYYSHENSSEAAVVDNFNSVLGQDFEQTEVLCTEATKRLSEVILELFAVSSGVEDRYHYKKCFDEIQQLPSIQESKTGSRRKSSL
ncbi:hypothetical protein Dsin_019768 [Dipteronia sinensis]|uniref:Uncharacterized protein n=1 Tax=Dipteronia sinensis TaxID=43782 RepID=A0AAE0E2U8_9ROSI|nr:hypothetical protein Dsin_019768 [Dipteronia sinensis]